MSSESLPFSDGDFDLVYSIAALEHVPDPGGTLAEVMRVLRPGGLAVHEIDLKHHGSADPLKFLEWDDSEWNARTRRYGENLRLDAILDGRYSGEVFCNRLRQSDWAAQFTHAGLIIEALEPVILLNSELVRPERFVVPFRALAIEELRVLTIRVVARRPWLSNDTGNEGTTPYQKR
ncbi:MAG: methyltransferase domain-containing protein [Acidobacteriota bacterium]